eukprot:365386-Chlamydomonas_euryale.AAC.5
MPPTGLGKRAAVCTSGGNGQGDGEKDCFEGCSQLAGRGAKGGEDGGSSRDRMEGVGKVVRRDFSQGGGDSGEYNEAAGGCRLADG